MAEFGWNETIIKLTLNMLKVLVNLSIVEFMMSKGSLSIDLLQFIPRISLSIEGLCGRILIDYMVANKGSGVLLNILTTLLRLKIELEEI